MTEAGYDISCITGPPRGLGAEGRELGRRSGPNLRCVAPMLTIMCLSPGLPGGVVTGFSIAMPLGLVWMFAAIPVIIGFKDRRHWSVVTFFSICTFSAVSLPPGAGRCRRHALGHHRAIAGSDLSRLVLRALAAPHGAVLAAPHPHAAPEILAALDHPGSVGGRRRTHGLLGLQGCRSDLARQQFSPPEEISVSKDSEIRCRRLGSMGPAYDLDACLLLVLVTTFTLRQLLGRLASDVTPVSHPVVTRVRR